MPVSVGDYVLGGGEVAVLVIVEAVARLLPGVIGNSESLVEESLEDGLLEYPVYTKPASWRGLDVPAVLTSGHHGHVAPLATGRAAAPDRRAADPTCWLPWIPRRSTALTGAGSWTRCECSTAEGLGE